tara:strand:+ start:389 stop:589 length:201 start_codon:yes stop_codon:yes gene_type:complete
MARATVKEVAAQIDQHEAVCAERWSNANDRFDRLEELISQNTVRLWWIAGIIISLLASLVFKLMVL